MPNNDFDSTDDICRIYRENEEKLQPVLDSLRQLHAQPPRRIDYLMLAHSIYQADQTPIDAITGEQLRDALFRFSRESPSIVLDLFSCEAAGVDPLDGAARMRSLYPSHPGSTLPAQSPASGTSAPPEDPKREPRKVLARARRGRAPDMGRHRAIGKIVSLHADWRANPASWREPSALARICADLDAAVESSDEPASLDTPLGWKTGKTRCLEEMRLRGWSDALDHAPKSLVADQINYSLKMLRRCDG
jgi:hypothetical protein